MTQPIHPAGQASPAPPPDVALPTVDNAPPASEIATATVTHAGGGAAATGARPAPPGYEVLAELGRGGMGVVYKARQASLNRLVALKMILSGVHASANDMARFLIEAEAVAAMQHPNIVRIYEISQHDGRPYFTLEYLDGGTLSGRLRNGPLPANEAARIVKDLADGLAYAHDKGIIHRDIKPANVLFAADGTPKITDFGLAKQMGADHDRDSGLTATGAAVGTPSFMPPEQARGEKATIGPRADVYALGATLYAMLTGRPPFQGASVVDTLALVTTQEPLAPSQLVPRLPRDLETICLKCLEKDPAKRYATAHDLAADLSRFLAGEPIVARPVGQVERAVKWMRRRPAVAALLATLAIVIVSAFAVVTWQLGQTKAALTTAEQQTRERALAQVNALRDSAPGAVPNILTDLGRDRFDVLPRLQELWASERDPAKRMRLALALLPVEPETVRPELTEWMLQADDPAEVLLAREALLPHKAELTTPLWTKAEDGNMPEAERFRALVALAAFDAESPRWTKSAPAAADRMLSSNPLHLASWMQALRPVRGPLLSPLGEVYRGAKLAEYQKTAAFILADYADDQPHVLADLLMDADEQQFALLYRKVNDEKHGDRAVSALLAEIDRQPAPVKDKFILEAKGTIGAGDKKVKITIGQKSYALLSKQFEVRLQVGKRYIVTMDSQDLDSFLVLHDRTGKHVFDDDGGGGLNSYLVFAPPSDAAYTVVAASIAKTGAFALKIVEVPGADDAREKLAKRQANAAVALLRLGKADEKVWRQFKHGPDPRVRSYLIHRLGPLGAAADAAVIIQRLKDEPDVTSRRALILSLGDFGAKISPAERKRLLPTLQEMYTSATDPGLHAASEWLLRTWQEEAWLKQVNLKWAKDGQQRKRRLEEIKRLSAQLKQKRPPQWYVNGQAQTMVVIPGPVEVLMGSPLMEADRQENEVQHKKEIDRTFAIAAKSVTVEQYLQFEKAYKIPEKYTRMPDLPVLGVTWYQAAAYCNWLSNEEGIDENQWCYETNSEGQVTRLKADYLGLAGYRLPTEAEMEYATRAGAVTSRYYGETDELLPKYAWYLKNAKETTWPVGSLKPNDLGLFDVQGNVFTWCQESFKQYPPGKGDEVVKDEEAGFLILPTVGRVVRGGSFIFQASNVRSAYRFENVPLGRVDSVGFRVARTIRPE